MLIERCGFLRDGRPVRYTNPIIRGDTYDFVAELMDLLASDDEHPYRRRQA